MIFIMCYYSLSGKAMFTKFWRQNRQQTRIEFGLVGTILKTPLLLNYMTWRKNQVTMVTTKRGR